MRIKHNAFTLTELLIALGVIGVLTAIVMPIVFGLLPNQNVIMAKRAFYTAETVVSDLLNDNTCYPRILSRAGFDDGLGYGKCKKYGGEDNPSKLNQDNSAEKFVTLFADRLNLRGDITTSGGKYKFKTSEGLEWEFSNFNFVPGDADSYSIITVDTNPSSRSANCGESTYSGRCENSKTKDYDKFSMRVYARGKIQILDCWAIKAVMTEHKLVGKSNTVPDDCEGVEGYEKPPEDCSVPPSSKDSECCSDDRWKDSSVCSGCVIEPNTADDYCCKEESGSTWVGSQACDACTYTTPASSDDECCKVGHKWYGSEECNPCKYNATSLACCQKKASEETLYEGDACCDYEQITCQGKEYIINLVRLNTIGGLDCSNPSNAQYCTNGSQSTDAQYAVLPMALKYCASRGMTMAGTSVIHDAEEDILKQAQNLGINWGVLASGNSIYGAGSLNCTSTVQLNVSEWKLLDSGGSQWCVDNAPESVNNQADNNYFVCYKLK